MNVTVFNGSPAGKASATHAMAEAFLRGAATAGAETHNVFLDDCAVGQCRGCFACWFSTPGRCVLRDDMDRLLALYRQSDIVVFGTPVYTWNMTALLKNFVDRLAPLKSPRIAERNGDFDLEDAEPKTQRFVVLSNCGFPGENNFAVLRAAMACCNPTLEVYRNCGKLLTSANPQAVALVRPWLETVERAGWELVAEGAVADATAAALEAPLMDTDDDVAFLGMG